jgi:hypothetical protein
MLQPDKSITADAASEPNWASQNILMACSTVRDRAPGEKDVQFFEAINRLLGIDAGQRRYSSTISQRSLNLEDCRLGCDMGPTSGRCAPGSRRWD